MLAVMGQAKRKSGQCVVCRYKRPLRRDGTVGAHWLYTGGDRHQCDGTGKPPRPFQPSECADCLIHMYGQPNLLEACHSLSIETGRSAGDLLRLYMSDYHGGGHRSLRRTAAGVTGTRVTPNLGRRTCKPGARPGAGTGTPGKASGPAFPG